ncbi:hypothetical protein, partial [uncultured Anaerolinea sp.]|uniref:hypothetical protein n=1 Tax=uncultured Anaerolinea sp. TaxID=430695 RepID=UPI00260251A6
TRRWWNQPIIKYLSDFLTMDINFDIINTIPASKTMESTSQPERRMIHLRWCQYIPDWASVKLRGGQTHRDAA